MLQVLQTPREINWARRPVFEVDHERLDQAAIWSQLCVTEKRKDCRCGWWVRSRFPIELAPPHVCGSSCIGTSNTRSVERHSRDEVQRDWPKIRSWCNQMTNTVSRFTSDRGGVARTARGPRMKCNATRGKKSFHVLNRMIVASSEM